MCVCVYVYVHVCVCVCVCERERERERERGGGGQVGRQAGRQREREVLSDPRKIPFAISISYICHVAADTYRVVTSNTYCPCGLILQLRCWFVQSGWGVDWPQQALGLHHRRD